MKKLNLITESQIPDYAIGWANGHVDELPNGIYTAKFYAHCFELENGKKYYSPIGLRRSRAPWEEWEVKDGRIFNEKI